jgi:hypothetical protein
VPHIASVPNQYVPLQPLETRLLDALRGASRHQQEDIAIIAAPGAHRRLRAPFLRWLLLEAIPCTRLPIPRLQLGGATIDGCLDLRGCTRARVAANMRSRTNSAVAVPHSDRRRCAAEWRDGPGQS